MAFITPDAAIRVVWQDYAVSEAKIAPRCSFASGETVIGEFRVGIARYKLRTPTHGSIYSTDNGFEFVVQGFTPHWVGRGKTPDQAVLCWKEMVHADIQWLLGWRPFDFDGNETVGARWKLLNSLIDISTHKRETPIRMRQVGEIRFNKDQFHRFIKWADGTTDKVEYGKVPPDLAGFRDGTPIEAICLRNSQTGNLDSILHVDRTRVTRQLSTEQQMAYLKSLPTGNDLPESDIDWTQLR